MTLIVWSCEMSYMLTVGSYDGDFLWACMHLGSFGSVSYLLKTYQCKCILKVSSEWTKNIYTRVKVSLSQQSRSNNSMREHITNVKSLPESNFLVALVFFSKLNSHSLCRLTSLWDKFLSILRHSSKFECKLTGNLSSGGSARACVS